MEEGVRSAENHFGGVIKKKSSSGCLIIKKKGDGVGGLGASGLKKVFEPRKEKKRPRLVLTDSWSSDELLEPIRRNVADKYSNRSVAYKRGSVEDRSIGRNYEIDTENNRSRLGVFGFDECDGLEGRKIRMDYMDDRLKLIQRSGNHHWDSGIGPSRIAVDRRKDTCFNGKSSISGGMSKAFNYHGKNRYEMEEDESHLPIPFLREKHLEAPDEPIRVQGKNGVLKIMVNKKKFGSPDKCCDHRGAKDRKRSRLEAAVKKNEMVRPAFYSKSKHSEKPIILTRTEKSDLKSQISVPIKSNKAEYSETDNSDTLLKQELNTMQARSSTKAIKNEEKRNPPTDIVTPFRSKEGLTINNMTLLRGKEGQVKRGSGTEKQLLREKIRSMLLNSGWIIDYRPRRNRDYLDAVYINPNGTAYWSIIKAYDALLKQLEEDNNIKRNGESSPFTPLPEEILSKLTRQTRKKIEREMKKKKRDVGCSKSAKGIAMKESAEGTNSDLLEEKISSYMNQNYKSLKGRSHEANHVSGDDTSDNLYKGTSKQDRGDKPSDATKSHVIQGRKSRKIGRCTLLVRSSDKGLNSESDGFAPYMGKRTLLSWLIDSGIVHMSEKVQYMNRKKTKAMLEGWITRDGIHCGCCSKILTFSKFEIHAGSKQRQPFPNIYVESGLSLMQCQIDAWNRQEESERRGFHNVDVDGDDPNDDACGLCGDGGDLICCDSCPSTFHQSCLDIKNLPAGDWHCPNCSCKFCGFTCDINAEADDRTDGGLLLCSLCEKKYHQSCSQDLDDLPVDLGDTTNSFCGKKCQEVFGNLQKLLGVKHELEAGFSWSLVHRMDPALETLHLGFSQRVECNSKLAVALSVIDECFLPIVDRRSGVNLIHNVIYNCGSNFSRLNYGGFYTVILERGDEIISAASIRIHGTQLAEMPFIGTRHIYRRQGMCRQLLCAIESALCSLRVEKLIIPAIAEHMHTWTENFNFSPLEESHKKEIRSMNMLVFPGTDMLQKLLVNLEILAGSITANSDSKCIEANENHLMLSVLEENFGRDSSPKQDLHMGDDTRIQPSNKNSSSNKAASTCSVSQAPKDPSNNIPVIRSSLNASCEPLHQPSTEEALLCSKSMNELADSTANLESPSPSGVSPAILEVESSVLDHPRTAADNVVDNALEANAKEASFELVLDSVGETSSRNWVEEVIEFQNSVSIHTKHGNPVERLSTENTAKGVAPVESRIQS